MDEEKEKALQNLHEAGRAFNQAMNEWQNSANSFWTGLEPEEQLMAFCAVIERLHKGELEEKRSYRGVLYDTFGWGPEAYATAQCAGYLDIHNSIYTSDDLVSIAKFVVEDLGHEADEERIQEIIFKRLYY